MLAYNWERETSTWVLTIYLSLHCALTRDEKQSSWESFKDDNPLALVHTGDHDGDGARLQRRPHDALMVREALARLPHDVPEVKR